MASFGAKVVSYVTDRLTIFASGSVVFGKECGAHRRGFGRPPRGAAGSREHRRGSGTRHRTAHRRRRCWPSSPPLPPTAGAPRTPSAPRRRRPPSRRGPSPARRTRESSRANTPRVALSQIGARSPWRCGRNSGTALDGAMLAAICRERRRIVAEHVADPAERGAARLRRRRVHDDALVRREEDHAGRRVDGRRDDARESRWCRSGTSRRRRRRRRRPNMPPQASIAPTTTGVPAQGRPVRARDRRHG